MPFFTQSASTTARVDTVFLFILALSVLFLVGITSTNIYFLIRYNRKRHPRGEDIEENVALETAWTLIPLALFLGMFYFGWTNFEFMRTPPRDAMVIEGTARQWAWSFKYPNGRVTSEAFVALGKPFKFEMRSLDVIHGFYLPAFRVKTDVVPGKDNYLWFTPDRLGTFDIECTVICGVNHSYMLSKIHVLSEDDFRRWYFADENAPSAGAAVTVAASERVAETATAGSGARTSSGATAATGTAPGLAVLNAKSCLACHSIDGKPMVGPTFKGLYGKTETVVAEGKEKEVVVDDAYLRRAIQDPGTVLVKGYPPSMPPIPLTEQELRDVIAFIKTLR